MFRQTTGDSERAWIDRATEIPCNKYFSYPNILIYFTYAIRCLTKRGVPGAISLFIRTIFVPRVVLKLKRMIF